jgi:hypothetical protein
MKNREFLKPKELYEFALGEQERLLQEALSDTNRDYKRVSYLRKSVYILKQSLKC